MCSKLQWIEIKRRHMRCGKYTFYLLNKQWEIMSLNDMTFTYAAEWTQGHFTKRPSVPSLPQACWNQTPTLEQSDERAAVMGWRLAHHAPHPLRMWTLEIPPCPASLGRWGFRGAFGWGRRGDHHRGNRLRRARDRALLELLSRNCLDTHLKDMDGPTCNNGDGKSLFIFTIW